LPRLLAVGHVTWDRRPEGEVPGGSVTYATLTARRLGWEAGALTVAGPEFDPLRELPGVTVFLQPARSTTRFVNIYDGDGTRHQVCASRADRVELTPLPEEWRAADVVMLAPVAGEIEGGLGRAFAGDVVGALAQGWLREFAPDGRVSARDWPAPQHDLPGVHALFVSQHDLPAEGRRAPDYLAWVPMVVVTRGWRGSLLHLRESVHDVPTLPRPEVDPTGAGDVFAAAFLVRYHETGDPVEAAAFAGCAASCAVEGVGASSLGDRAEVARRLALRQRLIEEGEWDE
jgi:1D-myo-inositol 3-kinase